MGWKHPRNPRRAALRARRALALAIAPVQCVLASLPGLALTAGAAAAAAAALAAGPVTSASAAAGTPVLVLLQNGETTAPEATVLQNAGYSVTQATPTQWLAMTQSQFQGYAAIVIGDPSTSTCSALTPITANSGTDAIGTTWQAAVTGNLAVIGTAPAAAASAAASTLVTDSVAYAAARWNSSSTTGTGLYLSLNCEYAAASASTNVPLLNGVEGITSSNGLNVQGSLACTDSGTVNGWGAASAGTYSGFTSASLTAGGASWPSPSCPVEEAFASWPGKTAPWAGTFTPLGYDAASDAASNFTASSGATGQPYILLGTPVTASAALSPSTGGQVPAGTASGGAGNPSVPGLNEPLLNNVNTENGDFTQSSTDLTIPTYGPDLSFTRSYDSQVAQNQLQTGKPGPMGYGWTDNWAATLSAASPVPGDIYTIDGLRTDTGDGSSPSDVVGAADTVVQNGGDVYVADESDNHILEIPGTSKTQWGRTMTAGKMYVVAGSVTGSLGDSGSGSAQSGFLLNAPGGLAFDSSGNMIISDMGNNRVLVAPAANGTYYGVSMTAGDIYRIAGQNGTSGDSGDGASDVNSYLDNPVGLAVSSGDLYIADAGNNRVQEVYEGGNQWNQAMTRNDIYTVAGSSSGASGDTVNTAATSALLSLPEGIALDASGDLYIADTANNAVKEVAKAAGTQWGISMSARNLYDVAGSSGGSSGTTGDGGKATSALLNLPLEVAVTSTGLFIADSGNNRVQEAALTTHSEWGTSMTAADVYTVAGSSSGACGYSGDGGKATSAQMCYDVGISVTASSAIYIADQVNNRVREVNSSGTISTYAGNGQQVATAGNGAPAVNAALYNPEGEAFDSSGDVYIADAWNNRIQEIAAHSHTQFGISMTAGDVYTIAGNASGSNGSSGDGGAATSAYLYLPQAIAADSAGNLYIADSDNCRIQKVTASTGNISTIAGSAAGSCGTYQAGNGVAATSAAISQVQGLALDTGGDVFIADTFNNRVEEVYEGGQSFGQSMTKGDIYTIAGTGTQGYSGDSAAATSAKVYEPDALGVDAAGNLYISDWGNNRVREVPAATGTQRGQSMTKNDIYTIAGNGTAGTAGDGGPATSSNLNGPGNATVDAAGDLYISDTANNRVQEVPVASGAQWGQAMTANDAYTVAGSSSGASGSSGDGGPATSARLTVAENVSLDPEGDVYVTDKSDNRLREVVTGTPATITPAPSMTSALYPAPGGITVTQPGGAQVTFYSQSGGKCATAPYTQVAGSYCALPQDTGASLTYNSATSTWAFQSQPGTAYAFNSSGQLAGESDAAGNNLTVAYGTPAAGSGSCPATAASCNTITSAGGRSLVLGLNPAGEVTTATDPAGRTWTYGYAGSDLSSVKDPLGNVTSYAYDTGNANPLLTADLTSVTRPNGQAGGPDAGARTAIGWTSTGQATSVTDPMGYKATYSTSGYDPATGTGFIVVTDADGYTTDYYYLNGSLAARSDWTGTALTSEWDYVPDQSATGTQLDSATSNGAGATTSTAYQGGDPVSSTGPDGVGSQSATTTQQFTSLNQADCSSDANASSTCAQSSGPAAVAPGGTIAPPASVPPPGVTWTLYDTDGNQLYSTAGVYPPGSTTPSYARTTYQLFNGNTVTLNGAADSCAATAPSMSLPCATIDADGTVTQLGYNQAGDLTSSATPDGNGTEAADTTYAYDADGEQTAMTAPDGNLTGANAGNYTTTTSYNADGQQLTVTAGGGPGATVTPRATTSGYDANGDKTSVQSALGYTTTTTYNADSQASLVTDPDGHATLTCYDPDGNITQTVPPAGVAASSLTPASCPASYPSGYGSRLAADATTYTYNGYGEKTAMTTPAPAGQAGPESTSYTYDGNGRLTRTTAPPAGSANQVTVDTYNTDGQLATQTTGYGTTAAATASYCYDPDGDQTSVVYPDGNTSGVAPCQTTYPWTVSSSGNPAQAAYQTTSSYDSAGELVSVTAPATTAAPSGATTTYTYDPDGNKHTSTDPDGTTTTWAYSPAGKQTSATYSGSAAPSVTTAYDASGNMTAMTDASGNSSYAFNPFGELTSETNGAGQTTSYGYDAAGDTTSVSYPLPASATWAASSTVNYAYDHAALLTGITDFNGKTTAITDTPDGLPNSVTLGTTGDTIATTFDNTDAPSQITLNSGSSALQSFSYADTPAGNTLTETDTPASPQEPATYTYDTDARVTSMTPGTTTTLNYSFDPSGNLTTLPAGAAATYDHAGELTSSALAGATTSYTYDADGHRLAASQGAAPASGTWNGAGELTAYSNSTGSMSTTAYDGNGLRSSSATTPAGQPATTQQYTWDNTAAVPEMIMDSTNAYIYGTGTVPAEQVNLATGTATYLFTDLLGSVRGAVNSSGALTGTTSYDAWGNPQNPGGLTAITPFGFAGGYTDPTGLIYLVNRYYDPATGQFLSVDPEVSSTLQPYAYASGNPVDQTDPTGLLSARGIASWALANVGGGYNGFGDDCTDFTSRALYNGGGDAMDKPRNYIQLRQDDHYWWYQGGILRDWSFSWSVAHDLAEHLLLRNSQYLRYWQDAEAGDVIFANWSGASFSGISHVGVITSMQDGVPVITQHSPSQRQVSLHYWLQHGGSDVHVWVTVPQKG